MTTKAERFRDLHARDGCFLMPNAWDAGSARLLAAGGFAAIGTTSAGLAHSLGVEDAAGRVPLETALDNIRRIAAAVDIPVNADFENGYAHDPADLAETVRRCAETGAVGANIEDYSGDPVRGLYDTEFAVARIAAAVAAAEALPEPFTITARAEAHLYGVPDADAMVRDRLVRFAEAGAHCVYAPGLRDREEIAWLAAECRAPLNVLVGLPGMDATVAEMTALGVRRLSVGGALANAGWQAVLDAIGTMRAGRFDFTARAASSDDLARLFAQGAAEGAADDPDAGV